jgi:hypothetical protein
LISSREERERYR